MDQGLRTRLDCVANASVFIYAVSAVALPICLVTIKEELGISLTQAGALGFFATAGQIVTLILSGFVAARYGKIRVIKCALVMVAAGLLLFSQTSSYGFAIAIMLVIGMSSAVLEALLTPLVEDLYPEDNGSKQNLLHAFWPAGVLVSTLTVGELLSRGLSWRWVFVGVAAIVLVILASYPASRRIQLPPSEARFRHLGEILAQPKFWVLAMALFLAGGAEGGITYWLASYIQLNMGGLPRAGGFGVAVFALGMFVGRYAASKLSVRMDLGAMIRGSALLSIFAASSFFWVDQIWTVCVSVFLTGITVACFWPSLQTYAARMLPLDATLMMILISCFGMLGFSSGVFFMGIIGDHAGLKASFGLVPVYLILVLALALVERHVHVRPTAHRK